MSHAKCFERREERRVRRTNDAGDEGLAFAMRRVNDPIPISFPFLLVLAFGQSPGLFVLPLFPRHADVASL